MATITAIKALMTNMGRHFKFPGANTEIDMAALTADYHAALGVLADREMPALWQQILTEHASSFAPTPAQCLKMVAPYRQAKRVTRAEHPLITAAPMPAAERALVAARLGRMRELMNSGEWERMTHAQAYEAVYGPDQPAAHKRQVLQNVDATSRGGTRKPTLALDVDPNRP